MQNLLRVVTFTFILLVATLALLTRNRTNPKTQISVLDTNESEEPKLVSAFFGLDDAMPFLPSFCLRSKGKDGMPVIFSHEIERSTLRPNSFLITTSTGKTHRPICVTLAPALDLGELRTALLIGDFGGLDDPPARVVVTGNVLALNGDSFLGAEAKVVQYEDGPSLVLAQIVPEGQWELGKSSGRRQGTGCPETSEQVLRVTWNGGVRRPGGEEVGEEERGLYQVDVRGEGGDVVVVVPFALADLNDNDNNHKLCLDVTGVPLSVSFPAGVLEDPAGHLNLITRVNVTTFH